MSAAFSFGPLGAMTDLVVAPAVQVESERQVKLTTTSRGQRWAQRARRNPRTWQVSRPWQDPAFARLLSLAASGLGGDMYLYDRACARQNMIPAHLATGVGPGVNVRMSGDITRTNLLTNPSFESGVTQTGTGAGGSTIGINTGGGADAATDTAWFSRGTRSAKVSGGTEPSTSLYPLSFSASRCAAWVGSQPGDTYTFGCDIHLDAAQTGALDNMARRVTFNAFGGTAGGWNVAQSNVAPNAAGTTRLVMTFTIPSGITGWHIRMMNGSTETPAWFDAMTLERGTTDGSYFDGSTPASGEYTYEWAGTPNASVSYQVRGRSISVPLGAVYWDTIRVPVLAGRLYTLSAWYTPNQFPASFAYVPGLSGKFFLPRAEASGYTAVSFTPKQDGLASITIDDEGLETTGIRLHEGPPDHLFMTSPGTPCKVAVADPEQTYQLVTDRQTRIDYAVTLYEVGDTGAY